MQKLIILILLSCFSASLAEAAAAYRNGRYVTGAGTSISTTEASGLAPQQDDIIIAAIIMNSNASAHQTPAGWTQLYAGDGTDADFLVFWTRRGAGAPTYSFSWTGAVGTVEMLVTAWSGAIATGNPFEVSPNSGIQSINPAAPNSPSATFASNDILVISLGMTWMGFDTGGGTVPTGYTNRHNGAGTDIGIADKFFVSGATEDPAAWGNVGNPWGTDCLGFTLALKSTTSSGGLTAKSKIKLMENSTNGSNMTILASADSISNDVTYTLPPADGGSGQVLSTNASGVLSWTSPGTKWTLTTKASNYSIISTDRNVFYLVSGTTTMTLPSPATVGAGYRVGFNNSGSNTVTVQRNASETVNGANSISLTAGEAVILITDGTNWYYH